MQLAVAPLLADSNADVGDEDLCHVAVTNSLTEALCGASLAGRGGDVPPHRGHVVDGLCTGCQRKICLTCESLDDRELLLLGRSLS